jgi:hypothetical protein
MSAIEHRDITLDGDKHEPKPHASRHAPLGADPILSGNLPAHASRHNAGGSDAITFPSPNRTISFGIAGAVSATATNIASMEWRLGSFNIVGVYLSTGAVTSGALTVDINVNGTSIFTAGNRPGIPTGTQTGNSIVIANPSLIDGNVVSVDIDAVGTTTGGNLNVTIVVQPV